MVTKTADRVTIIQKLSPISVTKTTTKSLLNSDHLVISKRIKVKKNFLCQTVRYGRPRKNRLMPWTPRLVFLPSTILQDFSFIARFFFMHHKIFNLARNRARSHDKIFIVISNPGIDPKTPFFHRLANLALKS